MHVTEITINGFKSYSKLTKIERFDPSFNAITGLNGSGKSNILDSICFVLGIKNLSSVRAAQLQDLVYKSGQAGIKEASVAIKFDNSDAARSPSGYQNTREIVVERRIVIGAPSKYFINGMKKTEKQVADMFATVQLNVNNPHFLIMQGRINKVINMRPPELLGLIEEAAGTKFFEKKKQESLSMIKKKDARIEDIDKMLHDEIQPKVDKLKKEKDKYQEYQRLKIRVTTGHKMLQAIKHRDYKATIAEKEDEVAELEQKTADAERKTADDAEQRDAIQGEVDELRTQAQNESGTNELEHMVAQLKEVLVASNAEHKKHNEDLADLKKKAKETARSRDDDRKEIDRKEAELAKKEASYGGAEGSGEADLKAVEEAEAELENLRQGKFQDADGNARTITQQLMDARRALNEHKTKATTSDRRLKGNNARLNDLRKQLASTSAGNDSADQRRLEALNKQIDKLAGEMGASGYDGARHEALRGSCQELGGRQHHLEQQRRTWAAQNIKLQFCQRDMYSKEEVAGLVAELITIKDPATFSGALETAAGGMVYQVVIRDSNLGTRILDRWPRNQGRLNMLPLDRLAPSTTPRNKLQRAQQIAADMGGEVWDAVDLVEADPRYSDVVKMVFGSKLICSSKEIATKICYDRGVSMRCYTLQGDMYNPGGTITGGATKTQGGPVFERMARGRALAEQLADVTRDHAAAVEEERRLRGLREAFQDLQTRHDTAAAAAAELRTALSSNEHGRLTAEIADLEEQNRAAKTELDEAVAGKAAADATVAELVEKEQNQGKLKKKLVDAATKKAAEARERLQANKANYQQSKQVLGALREELKQLRADVETYSTELEANTAAMAEVEATLAEKGKSLDEDKKRSAEAGKALEAYRAKLKERDNAIKKKEKELQKLKDDMDSAEVAMQEIARTLKAATDSCKFAHTQLATLMRNEDWMEKECALFGKKEGAYNYGTRTAAEEEAAQAADKARYEELDRTVNVKAMTRLTETQNKASELVTKRLRLDHDKESLQKAIAELDEKKKEKILCAYEKVTNDFGAIFSDLLPDANAKLVPPAGKTPLDGLEFRVSFGGNWKESLGELSGGQKSLVALSLILAMLRFKPAPIYILDEVDAALDLSHTQNVGTMIKRHFSESQFIIVSLKEGMFNNANVLYKTRFIDGCSTVSRHTPGGNARK